LSYIVTHLRTSCTLVDATAQFWGDGEALCVEYCYYTTDASVTSSAPNCDWTGVINVRISVICDPSRDSFLDLYCRAQQQAVVRLGLAVQGDGEPPSSDGIVHSDLDRVCAGGSVEWDG